VCACVRAERENQYVKRRKGREGEREAAVAVVVVVHQEMVAVVQTALFGVRMSVFGVV